MIENPRIISVNPEPNTSGAVLRQPIEILFQCASLVDPRSFSDQTFALYGPGDVITDTGPGTVLNSSGLAADPYRTIDGIVVRERISGVFEVVYAPGQGYDEQYNSIHLGVSGTRIIARFTPSVPLNPNTIYEAVLLGDGATGNLDSLGAGCLTSWTSQPYFSGLSNTGIAVVESYYSTSITSIFENSKGWNDTYHIRVNSVSGLTFEWWRDSDPLDVHAISGSIGIPYRLDNHLVVRLDQTVQAGQQYSLYVFLPQKLEDTQVWHFATTELNTVTPPVTPVPAPVIIDPAGVLTSPSTTDNLRIVQTWPCNGDYAISSGLPVVVIEFNKELRSDLVTSEILTPSDLMLRISPLLGIPNIAVNPSFQPASLEISGRFLKLWL